MDPFTFERGEFFYLVSAVAPIKPTSQEIEELAFAEQLQSTAPNESIMWMRGQYVEGDKSNKNGQTWSSEELSIKSLTPRFMPVTVMHDPRTAVGLIADTKLLLPDADGVPRPRIDTTLAIWAHRFPEIAEECALNYQQGTLMQSMECVIGHYECLDCGKGFVKLPGNAERANWCTHMTESAEKGEPVRRLLRDVTFTGVGLILGTRNGATGALDTAHLEIAEEIAEFHDRAKSGRRTPRRTSVDEITIKRSEYDALKAESAKASDLASRVVALEVEVAKAADLTKANEKLELDLKAAETARDEEKTAREALEETARAATLSGERIGKLGTAFVAALTDKIKTRLTEQAKVMSDEDWTARLDELSELTKVKVEESTPENAGTVTTTETASTKLGGTAPSAEPSKAALTSVLGGLLRSTRPTPAPAQK